MTTIQELTAAIWHDLTCQTCRKHKGNKRVNSISYRKQAIERRQKLDRKLARKAQRKEDLKVLVSITGLIGVMLLIIMLSDYLRP